MNTDDFKHWNIRDIRNLFNQSIDKDYYKPIRTKSAFNGNYIEYESKGDKSKKLLPKKYLDMIRPYLSDLMNDHKPLKKLSWVSIMMMTIRSIINLEIIVITLEHLEELLIIFEI